MEASGRSFCLWHQIHYENCHKPRFKKNSYRRDENKIMMRYFIVYVFLIAGCSAVREDILAHRKEYKDDFLTDPRSPLKKEDLSNLDFYKPISSARVVAKFTTTPKAEPFEMPTYSGVTRSYRKYGEARFLWDQDSVTLSIYQNLTLISNPLYN